METQSQANSTSTSESYTIEAMLSAQGLTDVSEQDLMGTVAQTEPEKPATQEPSSEDTGTKEEEDTKPSDVKTPTQEEPAEPTESKPPKGFVPLEALREVRGENKFLKQQLVSLQEQVSQLATQKPAADGETQAPAENPFADFVVLTDAEYAALADESPSEALVYMNKLVAFKDYKRNEADQAKAQIETEAYLAGIFERTNAAMEEAVPGLFDENSGAMAELREFAENVGFTEDLFYLTNPATKVILPGESEPLVLGEHAASIIKMLAKARSTIKDVKSTTVDEAALRARITAEVEQEILAKIKAGGQFKSLNALPPSHTTQPSSSDRVLSEAELAKLSAVELEAYLSGR